MGAQVERLHELVAVQVVDRTGAAIAAATAQAEDEIGRERAAASQREAAAREAAEAEARRARADADAAREAVAAEARRVRETAEEKLAAAREQLRIKAEQKLSSRPSRSSGAPTSVRRPGSPRLARRLREASERGPKSPRSSPRRSGGSKPPTAGSSWRLSRLSARPRSRRS